MLQWHWKRFSSLTRAELYAVLQARQDVFVVEQRCPYLDLDGLDQRAWHLLGTHETQGLCAYLRVLPPGMVFDEPAIGRVLTVAQARGRGYGRALIHEGVRRTSHAFPRLGIRISAQCHLEPLYNELGFTAVGEPYLEDDIAHIEMYRP